MTSPSTEKPRSPAKVARSKRRGTPKSKALPESSVNNAAESAAEHNREPRTTKQERVLTLLSLPEGASIEEMMQATGWQQHSVRGFLAGTVKKKLGFDLTSSKADAEARRYRIETRRGD